MWGGGANMTCLEAPTAVSRHLCPFAAGWIGGVYGTISGPSRLIGASQPPRRQQLLIEEMLFVVCTRLVSVYILHGCA